MNTAGWWPALDAAGYQVARGLLSLMWQSSILIAAAALLAWALRRRRTSVRHAVWVAALLVVPALPVLTWIASSTGVPPAGIPVMPDYAPAQSAAEVWPGPVSAGTVEPSAPAALRGARDDPAVPVSPVAVTLPAGPAAGRAAPAVTEPPPAGLADAAGHAGASLLDYPWALALLAYVAGVLLMLALVLVGRWRIRGWIRRSVPVTDARVLGAFRAARHRVGLRRHVVVVAGPAVQTPMTMRAVHPVVLLPVDFAEGLSDLELRTVAAHELAHVRRHDALLLAVVSLVRAALFFHPLAWLAARRVAHLAEVAADDAALEATGEPVSYAKVLARLAETLPRRAPAAEMAAGFLLSRSALLRRVEAILSDRRDALRRLSRLGLAATLAAGLVSLAVAAGMPLGERPARAAGAAETEQKAATGDEAGDAWGEAVGGFQCRLRSDRTEFFRGEAPLLWLDVRNTSGRDLVAPLAYRLAEPEVDGTPYAWQGICKDQPAGLAAGARVDGIVFYLDGLHSGHYGSWVNPSGRTWNNSATGDLPGKVTVRVALVATDPSTKATLRAVSNPVELRFCPDERVLGRFSGALVRAGAIDELKAMIAEHPELVHANQHAVDWPIIRAAREGTAEVVRLLLDHGASVRARSEWLAGGTALHETAARGKTDVAAVLLDAGAEVNGARTRDGLTPLALAAVQGRLETVKLLAARGADLRIRSAEGLTPLLAAAIGGRDDVATWLAGRASDLDISSAAAVGDLARVKELLDGRADLVGDAAYGLQPLHLAAHTGRQEMAELLISRGADVNALDARNGAPPILYAVLRAPAPMIEMLLAKGADPSGRAEGGVSALHLAAQRGLAEVAELLLARGALAGAANDRGRTPLHEAALGQQARIVRLLLARGADPKAADRDGTTPLQDLGRRAGLTPDGLEVARLLVAAGADVTAGQAAGKGPMHGVLSTFHAGRADAGALVAALGLFIEHGADVNAPNWRGVPPLGAAIESKADAAVKVLIEAGADPFAPGMFGDSLVILAADRATPEALQLVRSVPKVRAAEADAQDAALAFVQGLVAGDEQAWKACVLQGKPFRDAAYWKARVKDLMKKYAEDPDRLTLVVNVLSDGAFAVVVCDRPDGDGPVDGRNPYLLLGLMRTADDEWRLVDVSYKSDSRPREVAGWFTWLSRAHRGVRHRMLADASRADEVPVEKGWAFMPTEHTRLVAFTAGGRLKLRLESPTENGRRDVELHGDHLCVWQGAGFRRMESLACTTPHAKVRITGDAVHLNVHLKRGQGEAAIDLHDGKVRFRGDGGTVQADRITVALPLPESLAARGGAAFEAKGSRIVADEIVFDWQGTGSLVATGNIRLTRDGQGAVRAERLTVTLPGFTVSADGDEAAPDE